MDDPITKLFPALPICPLTRQLVARLFFDLPMTASLVADFGIRSEDHYRALRTALWYTADDIETGDDDNEEHAASLSDLRQRIVALDAAYGNGPRLNAFVRQYAPAYAAQVRFETVWDGLVWETDPA